MEKDDEKALLKKIEKMEAEAPEGDNN